jgi:hypothetical protein
MTDRRDDHPPTNQSRTTEPRAHDPAIAGPRANDPAIAEPQANRSAMPDDIENLPALAATIEPLPGGLGQLRMRLRAPVRSRAQLGLAIAAACCAAIALWLLRTPPRTAAGRSALHRVLVDSTDLPHPLAVELGLVEPGRPVVVSDPRIAPSDTAVFFWVPPAQR